MAKKVLLVIPPLSEYYPDFSETENLVEDKSFDIVHPPLGVAYLAAVLRKKGISVQIYDMPINGFGFDDFKKYLVIETPDIVGVSSMTSTYNHSLEIAKITKKLNNKIITVLGGNHSTFLPQEALKNFFVDFVVRNEGEYTFLELVEKIGQTEQYYSIKGISYKKGKKIINNPQREIIKNLDELPFPAYDLLNMERYAKIESLGVLTSRGCPYNCKFCSSTLMWETRIRSRSVKNTFEEIEYIVKNYDYKSKEFWFYDDTFTISLKRITEICDELKKRDYRLKWKCMGRVNLINEEMLNVMKDAGCFRIAFGLESGSQRSLDRIDKRITVAQIKNAIKLCKKVGISVEAFFIIGFPWETKYDFKKTLNLISELNAEETSLAMLVPFPGTEFYTKRKEFGINISIKNWDKYTGFIPLFNTKNFTEKELAEYFLEYICITKFKKNRNRRYS